MITALDTSVLLDVFDGAHEFGPASRSAVKACLFRGRLIACEVVWAELTGFVLLPEAARTAPPLCPTPGNCPPTVPRPLLISGAAGEAVAARAGVDWVDWSQYLETGLSGR